ncbi:RING-type domain-containing protein [Aphis craccivora]|uniref:RING-type domain-containing protein n=1 Tax=Aphis craccivora TaxID=307492 RepID=A0A6G0VS13_APHCR|nr:RING-type domain-containing protein [Aphis craccivora]
MEVNVEQALRVVRQVRRTVSPPIPADLRSMGETIASVRWQCRLSFVADDINNVSFYQGPLAFIEDGHSIFGGLLFANIDFIRHHGPFLQRAQVLAVDGTFGVVPRFPGDIDQLVTIYAVLDNISIPLVYALTNQRTELVYYIRLWKFLSTDLPFELFEWDRMQVIADFELAQRNAIRRVIPECRLVGCWFHFNQSIVRYIRTHGMNEIVHNNYNVATVIRMVLL